MLKAKGEAAFLIKGSALVTEVLRECYAFHLRAERSAVVRILRTAAFVSAGNIYIADSNNHRVRVVGV